MLRFMVVTILFCLPFTQGNMGSASAAASSAAGPVGYTFCAKQNGICRFTGTAVTCTKYSSGWRGNCRAAFGSKRGNWGSARRVSFTGPGLRCCGALA